MSKESDIGYICSIDERDVCLIGRLTHVVLLLMTKGDRRDVDNIFEQPIDTWRRQVCMDRCQKCKFRLKYFDKEVVGRVTNLTLSADPDEEDQ